MAYKGLGRGLGSLIPTKIPAAYRFKPGQKPVEAGTSLPTLNEKLALSVQKSPSEKIITELSPQAIVMNPHQPRTSFDPRSQEELTESIRKHGLLQPLLVTSLGQDRYQLVAGERRLRSARILNLSKVPVIVRKTSELEKLELALVENIQRQDLNPLEEARAYQALIDEFGLTQEEVAKKIGKNRSVISNSLRLLQLPAIIQEALLEKIISVGHAKALLSFKTEAEQLKAFARIQRSQLSVRAVERQSSSKKKSPALSPDLSLLEEKLRTTLMTKVRLHDRQGLGKIVIEYYSSEELRQIVKIIVK